MEISQHPQELFSDDECHLVGLQFSFWRVLARFLGLHKILVKILVKICKFFLKEFCTHIYRVNILTKMHLTEFYISFQFGLGKLAVRLIL